MASTINNGVYFLSDLSGVTVQGTQFRDTGEVRVGTVGYSQISFNASTGVVG